MNQHDKNHYRFPRSSREATGEFAKFHDQDDPESGLIWAILLWVGVVVLCLAMFGWL